MAGTSLLALLDDIATLLDDVSVMSKIAVKKTAGVLGDDLALNAQQVTGVAADRELPVVWAVAKGSLVNKAILVPAGIGISAVLPAAVLPLLMMGGAYLCYEGFEKLAHKLFGKGDEEAEHERLLAAVSDPKVDLVAFEREKIRGAVRTDFILSAEILVITLGTVSAESFSRRVGVMVAVSLIMTVAVYGLVAAIVKLDDLGARWTRQADLRRSLGRAILKLAPFLMKGLGIAGTAAMFLVGGGIIAHGISFLHHWIEGVAAGLAAVPRVGALLGGLSSILLNGAVGVLAGGVVLGVVKLAGRLKR